MTTPNPDRTLSTMPIDGPSRFKSRFSVISLRYSRHRPLDISNKMPPNQSVPCHSTVVSNMSRSAVHFECPSLFTSSPSPQTEQDRRTPTPHRPTPLNLKKTKAIYPSRPAVNSPELSTLPVVEKPSKVKKVANDPFEVAEVESGHRYPHWKGGKVDIRPGELIPQGVLGISSGRPSIQAGKREPDQIQYESVLHNVLLTPTYLGSPVSSPSPSAFASKSYLKHRTLVVRDADPFQSAAKISSSSKWVGKNPEENWDDKVGRSIRDMREREEREMDRFRWAASQVRNLDADAIVLGLSPSQSPEISHAYCRSPGLREWSLGAMSATRKHEKGSKHLKGWNGRRGEDSKVKWRHKFGKVQCLHSEKEVKLMGSVCNRFGYSLPSCPHRRALHLNPHQILLLQASGIIRIQ